MYTLVQVVHCCTCTLPGGGSKRTKVEMQILHLSKDAQDRVEKTLSELYGGQYKLRDAR